MNPELLSEAKVLWKRTERTFKFQSRHNLYPFKEGVRLVDDLSLFCENIPVNPIPSSQEEVYNAELRRKLKGNGVRLQNWLEGKNYTFGDVINLYSMDIRDIEGLKGWLEVNRQPTLDKIDQVYADTEVEEYDLPIHADIPVDVANASGNATAVVDKYHKNIGRLFTELTPAGNYLRDITVALTTSPRSYFDLFTNTLALGLPAICYQRPDRTVHINERALINLLGHEGMGHGLNKAMTDMSDLPFFLKESTHASAATVESIGQFYEQVIFEELAKAPKVLSDLDIAHKFEDIYAEEKNLAQITEYQRKLFQYAITVLADKNLGAPLDSEAARRKREKIAEVALYPGYGNWLVETYKYQFDFDGNLSENLVGELRYCSQAVMHALDVLNARGITYDSDNRSGIDSMLLTGFWTPVGYVENAKVLKV